MDHPEQHCDHESSDKDKSRTNYHSGKTILNVQEGYNLNHCSHKHIMYLLAVPDNTSYV